MVLSQSLRDLRVVDLTRLLPGPYCTLLLADLGADVVKVEQPGVGDYLRMLPPLIDGIGARFRAVNRGKRSLALDLQSPAGREVVLRLVREAEVVVEGFRPGVLDRLGLGFEALREVRPDIILCSISGYGKTGPYTQRAGHDLNYLALSGLLAEMATEGAPTPLPVQIADLVGGGLFGVMAILAALQRKRHTSEPAHLDISMTEGVLALMGPEIAELLAAGEERAPPGQGILTGGHATYDVYKAADGGLLSVGALEPKFAGGLGELVGFDARPDEMVAGPERQQELRTILADQIASRPLAEWTDLLADRDVCCEPVLPVAELPNHPQHRARQVFRTGPVAGVSADGPVQTPCARVDDQRTAPGLGEHSEQILAEAGYSAEEIRQLVDDHVVQLPL